MPPEDEALSSGILLDRLFDHQGKFKSGTLPRQPGDLSSKLTVKFRELLFSIGTGSECNRPIGVQMVHMIKMQKSVQSCINGRRYTILPKRGDRIVAHHLIFEFLAAIDLLQLLQTVEIKNCET